MPGGSSQGREQNGRAAGSAAAFDPCFEPIAAVVRGRAVESIHRGAIAVVDTDGTLLGGVGDPGAYVLLRSAAKPFQAAAIVASGVAEAFSLTGEEIAMMAASHAGTPEHVEAVGRLLARGDISAASLVCGPVEHMCSGKHAGMLLLARHLGVSGDGYERDDHPVQREIAGYVASLLENGPGRPPRIASGNSTRPGTRALFAGTDGCGVPVLGMTLREAAWLFALLAAGATPALARVRDAMRAHPLLVAGDGRLDTDLMRAGAGAVVAKAGAEGVQGIGLVGGAGAGPVGVSPGGAGPVGGAEGASGGGAAAGGAASSGAAGPVGFVMKVEDGSGRPIPAVAAAFLRAWGAPLEAAAVERDHPAGILGRTGAEVARIELLVEQSGLRRPTGAHAGDSNSVDGAAAGSLRATGDSALTARRLFGRKGERLTVGRGDEKEVLRFLREQWPAVDKEYFGRAVEWSADPYSLIFRRDGRVVAVLRGHFIGGLASVDELMVEEGSRGAGLGSTILGRFEDEARKRRCARIVLRAVKGSPAEDFYRKRGYHREVVQYGYEFGYDYVRLTCDPEQAPGEAGGPAGEDKGAL
jgi:L-asparaginase II/GNAT superfamily N-acetyltransferase